MKDLKQKAFKIYDKADEKTQKVLIDLFGKDTFKKSIIKVKTVEEICKIEGIKLVDIIPYKNPQNSDEENTNSFVIVKLICKFLNQRWKPDFKDTNQKKWYPYFDLSSGFRFYGTYYFYYFTLSAVGSRLCYGTSELAEYAGKTFTSYYEKLIIK